MEIPLGGSFYKLDSLPISAQECVNFYVNIPEVITPSKRQLFIPAGIDLACTAGTAVTNRGGHNFNNLAYMVQGHGLYRIDQTVNGFGDVSYTSTLVSGSTAIPGNERVIIADNGEEGGQMMIVCPEYDTKFNAFIYTVGGGLNPVSDADFDGPVSSVVYVDGYFLFTKKDSQKFFISELRNGSSYISTDFERAEADPDYVVGPIILRNAPYIFGKGTVQGYQNVGGAGFPFVYVQGSVLSKGLRSIYGSITFDDNVIFVGGSVNEAPAIWISNGGPCEKLSTIAIDQELSAYSQDAISNCFTWNYSQSGGRFIGFTFPGEKTFVFDFVSKEWHTRESFDSLGNAGPCRISTVIDVYGVLMVGDTMTNNIGILSKTTYDEYGEILQRRFVTPHIDNEGEPFFINSVELACKTGLGLTTGQGSNPKVMLSISRDGGRTFSNPLAREVGKIGEYTKRVIWGQQGRAPTEVCFRFDVSDPVGWAITKTMVEFE